MMAYVEEQQLSLFDLLAGADPGPQPGDWVEEHGPELTFEQTVQRLGELVVMDMSTESHAWYKVERLEQVIEHEGGRRLILYDGKHQRSLVNEMYFDKSLARFPARAYLLAGQTIEEIFPNT